MSETAASSHNRDKSLKPVAPFANLREGGTRLAEKLREDASLNDSIVLAIARAGVPVGNEIASQLKLLFDILLLRRLILAKGAGSELCVVNVAGTTIVDDEIEIPTQPATPTEYFLADAFSAFRQRHQLCRGGRDPIEIAGRNVLLVDCAIQTGSTVKIAIRALRKLEPTEITVAVPVASPDGRTLIESLADRVVCLAQPEPFGHAGLWYRDFTRPDDDEIHQFLNK